MNRNYKRLPHIIFNWLTLYGAWIVGSGASWYIRGEEKDPIPRDLDIIIPPDKFHDACKIIKEPVVWNSFGGLKAELDGVSTDFWPMSLDEFITVCSKKGENMAVRLRPGAVVTWTL